MAADLRGHGLRARGRLDGRNGSHQPLGLGVHLLLQRPESHGVGLVEPSGRGWGRRWGWSRGVPELDHRDPVVARGLAHSGLGLLLSGLALDEEVGVVQ